MSDNPRNAPPIKIGIEEDSASFARVEQRTTEFLSKIDALVKVNDAVAQSAQQMGRSLSDAFAQGATKVDANLKSIQALRKEVQGLGDDQGKATGGLKIEGLRRTGGALSQLGLGEVGGAISRVGDIAQIVKETDEFTKSLGPLGTVLPIAAGAALGFKGAMLLFQEQAEKNTAVVKQAISQLDTYYAAIAEGNTESTKKRLESLKRERDAVDKELGVINSSRDNAFTSAQKAYGDLGARIAFAAGQTGIYGDTLKETGAKTDELKKKSGDLTGQIDGLTAAMNDGAVAANDARQKEEDLANARKDRFQADLDNQVEIQKLIESGDKKGLEKRKASAEAELAIIQQFLEKNAERVAGDDELAKTYDEMVKRADKLKDSIANLGTAIAGIKPDVIGDFLKGLKKDADRIAGEVNDRNARVASAEQKYEDDVAKITDQGLSKRADIEKKYSDKLVEIARQAADAAEQALTKLTQQREDLLTGLNRDLDKEQRDAAVKTLDLQINAQREEVKALRDHQHELEQIRKDAYAREVGFLLDRNFKGLYESRLQTSSDLERSNEQFGSTRADRQQALSDQAEDLKRSIQRERSERLIAYQQSLQDAQTAYKRELLAAQQKRAQELALARQEEQAALSALAQTTANELRLRKNAYDKELQLVSLYGAAYVKANDQIMQALVSRAEQRLALINGTSGGSTNTVISGDTRRLLQRAGGGGLNRGDSSFVNELPGQRESYNGVPFPPGLGIFTALQGGTVSGGRSTGPITLNVYPSPGMDEERFAHKTLDLLESVIGRRP